MPLRSAGVPPHNGALPCTRLTSCTMTFETSPRWSRNEESSGDTDPGAARLRFDLFELDEAEARLTRAGEAISLAPKPFAVLCALARAPGRLVTKNALLDLVWGHRFVTHTSLKSAISDLRAALDDDPRQPRCIETVARRGYRFIATVVGSPVQSRTAVERRDVGGPGNPGLAALTALCRSDAALADLIRAVAAALERERLVLNDS